MSGLAPAGGRPHRARRSRLAGALAMALLLLLAEMALAAPGSAVTLTPDPRDAPKDYVSLATLGCFALYEQTANDECFFGRSGGPTIALIGDSHASSVFPGVDAAVKARLRGLSVFSKGSCPVADITRWYPKRRFTQCDTWRAWMLNQVWERRPDLTVIASSFNPDLVVYDRASGTLLRGSRARSAWVAGMRRTAKKLTATGSTVLVLRDVPSTPFDGPTCLIEKVLPSRCRFTRSATILEKAVVRDLANVHYADFTPRFCTGTLCNTAARGMVVYRDRSHLTKTFALSLTDYFDARFTSLVPRF